MTSDSSASGGNADVVAGAGVRSDPERATSEPPRGEPVYSVDSWRELIDAIESADHPNPDGILDRPNDLMASTLPQLDLPGFGEPDPDCGEFMVEALQVCDSCGYVHQNRHNCLRYDCPDHAAYAVRRRAAGSRSGSGVAPQLDALRRYLNAYRGDNQYFQHLTIEPPEDWVTESDKPLERTKEIVRLILDTLGIQGLVAYHPWKGDHEDHEADDRGKWRTRLFHGRDWHGDVRDELKPKGHFHVIGVAPFVDLRNVGELYDATGWVIHRITQEGTNISISDDEAMAKAVTYALSHAGIYETESGQRRLAAWMKGPDVDGLQVYQQNAARIGSIVERVAEDTLGIPSPSPKCSVDVPIQLDAPPARAGELPDVELASERRRAAGGPLAAEPIEGFGDGPGIDVKARSDPSTIALARPARWGDGVEPIPASSGDAGTTRCGGRKRHISQVGELLLSSSWRDQAPYADDADAAYRSYVDVMTSTGRDPLEDPRPDVPEHSPDRPPDD